VSYKKILGVKTMIQVEGIVKSYKDKNVLKGASLSIERGSFTGLVGSNGAGKSTLVDIICKAKKADNGKIRYDFDEKDLFSHIGVQVQEAGFDKRLKIKDIIDLWKTIYPCNATDIGELLDLFDLTPILDRRVDKVSGGQKQKLNILLAVFHNPELLIFDELTTGLDAVSRDGVHEYLKMLNTDRGKTIFIVSHYMDEVEALCNMVYFLKDGVIFESGSPSEVKERHGVDSLQDFVKSHMKGGK
jgi:ABC-2 type transport system ATP-binding protein